MVAVVANCLPAGLLVLSWSHAPAFVDSFPRAIRLHVFSSGELRAVQPVPNNIFLSYRPEALAGPTKV